MAETELKGKHVLVTGATGFIGSRLVQALLDSGAEVTAVVDRKSSLTRLEPLLSHPGLHLSRCSISNAQELSAERQKWGNIELLAHLGIHVPDSAGFCEQCLEEINLNLLPTINLVKSLDKCLKAICFASSVAVYGIPSRLPVREDDPPAPVSSYGATKLAIEQFLRAYGKVNNVPVTVLRYSTVYGPGELGHRAIPNFLNALSQGKSPVLYHYGQGVKDYVYVDDIVRATVLALARKPEQVLNIGAGRGYTSLHVAREVIRLFPANIEPELLPGEGKHVDITCDISAAKKAFDYTPQKNLEEGLAAEIAWYKKMVLTSKIEGGQLTAAPLKKSHDRHSSLYPRFKSIVERFLALIGLIVLSPVLLLIAIGIRLDSPGNPVFSQDRIGENGRKFKVYKFRSMPANNNHNDNGYKAYLRKYVLENAPYRVSENGQGIYKFDESRVTRFGALLRKTNLDELPQIFNILKGEMSFIGPRPDVPFAVDMYKDWHRERLAAKPGITGLWQVCGRKNLSFEDMVNLDIEYIKKQSPLLDIKILWSTVGTILGRDGS